MESMVKSIASILDPTPPQQVGDGFNVSNFFPRGYKIKMSPFFLLDYNVRTELAGSVEPRGVGVHPHRGFETVTIPYHGAIAHEDSAGNTGVIYPGDVQWMTAARGILHKEYYEKEFNTSGGILQTVQLWVNLPAKDKMSTPKYQSLKHSDICNVILPDNAGSVEVIAGEYVGVRGPASTFTPLNVFNAILNPGGTTVINLPREYNTGFLVIEGKITVNGDSTASENQFIYFNHDGESISLRASVKSTILILSGQPINEPIAQYGPFLMNRPEEIQQAIDDYNQGRFGYLEE